jgi:ubiquinone biosynthesis protein
VVVLRLLLGLPIAVLAASVASRLLGVRRSWVAFCTAGTVGWAAAVLVSLELSDGDWEDAALSGRTLVLTIVFTMLAAVLLDLVATPGTLARGDRAGLLVVPHPLADLRRALEPYARYREIARIARRNGLTVRLGRRGRLTDRSVAVALRQTFEQSGIVFVKLGQLMSTRDDLLPAVLTSELGALQSHVEPAPRDDMAAVLEDELGLPVDEVFAEFDWTPLGSASIAHAYSATLQSGERVIVKVQRPGMDDLVARDSRALMQLARTLERRTAVGRDLHAAAFAEQFTRHLRDELDFTIEAANMADIAAASNGTSAVRIPRVHEHLTSRRVLVQERFDGTKVTDRSRIEELGLDELSLADQLVRAMVDQLVHGHFHADPHPGNVLLLDDGRLGLIDFGMTGRLDQTQREALMQITLGAVRRDVATLRAGVEEVAVVGADVAGTALDRALRRFLADHVRPGHPIEASALHALVRLLAEFDISLPNELTACMRTLVLLDGTVREIHPGYSLIDGLRRVLEADEPAVVARTAQEQLTDAIVHELPRLRRLPGHVDRIAALAARGELRARISLFSTPQDTRAVAVLVNRVTFGLTGGLLALAGAVLLAVDPGGAGADTSVAEIFGYVLLAFAAVLVLRVVAAVVRDGYE